MKGFINLIKPEGMSSAFAVGAVKKKFHLPSGHMGTLDQISTGVLVICVNRATKLIPYINSTDRIYDVEMKFLDLWLVSCWLRFNDIRLVMNCLCVLL